VRILEGDANSALREPNSVAISRGSAEKYYPEGDALGKTLILDNRTAVKITAIYENMPSTGHFQYDILVSMAGLEEAESTNFLSNNFNTYILLKEGADAKALEAKQKEIIKEVEVKVEEIRQEKKEKKLKPVIEKPKAVLKLGDRVRMIDGRAIGTIDKIEKNKAVVNYGLFTSKVSLDELEFVEAAKK
jgi:hypothetical protein